MQDLRDKLLKAGLVTDEQAKRAESVPPRGNRSDRSRDRGHDDRPRDRGHDDRSPERGRDDRPREHRGGQGHRGGHSGQGHPGGHPAGGGHHAHAGAAHHGRSPPAGQRSDVGPRIPKLPPLPGSREYQRLESRKQLELDRKLLELARTNEIPVAPGEQTFYFVTRKGRLRRLELSAEQAGKLERGELAIVERREPSQIEHALVAPEIAAQMRELSDKSVRFLNTPGAAVGFLSDSELEAKKAEEAALGPEESEAAATAPAEDTPEAPGATDAASQPTAEAPPPATEPSGEPG